MPGSRVLQDFVSWDGGMVGGYSPLNEEKNGLKHTNHGGGWKMIFLSKWGDFVGFSA